MYALRDLQVILEKCFPGRRFRLIPTQDILLTDILCRLDILVIILTVFQNTEMGFS